MFMLSAPGRLRAAPRLLLLVLGLAVLGTARGGRAGLGGSRDPLGQAALCAGACDVLALPDPKEPASSTTDTAKAVSGILRGVFEVMKAFPVTKEIGAIGTALMFGVEGGTNSQKNPEYQTYKLQKDLKQSTDYLACKMDAMVHSLNVAADKRMSDNQLDDFNSGLRAVISEYAQHCGAMNCLSVAHLPPSQRSEYRLDCAFDGGLSPACPKTTSFNASRTCTFIDRFGETRHGQCDPNGHCFEVYRYSKAVAEVKSIVKEFSSKDNLDDFHRFDKSTDTEAILALAKGSLVKILMLQQLVMLDGTSGDNGALTQFAEEMANKLQARYDYLVSVDRLATVVGTLSRPSLALNDLHTDMVVWPRPRDTSACSIVKRGSKCEFKMQMSPSDAITVKAHIRKSCQTNPEVYEAKCFVQPHLKQCGYYDFSCAGQCNFCGTSCGGIWNRCVSDVRQADWSDFVGPYNDLQKGTAKVNQERCPGVLPAMKAAIREQATSLSADLAKELKDVKDIIATLRGIRQIGGMPRESFGILRKAYPRYAGACGSAVTRSALGSQRAACGRNCESCQPSWRCLKCEPGFRLDANGATCSK